MTSRWALVICDEVQDTNEEQWEFLQLIGQGRLLLLGDANQMIYTFIPGVSPERLRLIRESADRVIELEPRSHRDPSGAIPALAEAVRLRQFGHEAVQEALRTGRLTIHQNVDHAQHQELLLQEIEAARKAGSRDVGIFAHSNRAVAELADQLEQAEMDHVLVGIPEAHAEALAAMGVQCSLAIGQGTSADIRQALALFLTATVRSQEPPQMARALIGEVPLPGLVEQRLGELEATLMAAASGTMDDLVTVAMQSWEGLAIGAGYRVWRRAASHFRRLSQPLRSREVSQESVQLLRDIVERSRVEALIDLDYSERGRVKLMNYHQTKGREADTVIHVFRSDDYFGREVEPFEETSRLLNVAISRARQRVIVILPPEPHPLVEPFAAVSRNA